MSTSTPHREIVCNTTPVRIFAVIGQFDLLVDAIGGTVRVPREVLDPDEEEDLPGPLTCEIEKSRRFFLKRADDADAIQVGHRLGALRHRDDIEILDLTHAEQEHKAQLTTRATARVHGLAGPLGEGEAAVMAITRARDQVAAMDDAAARRVLAHIAPDVAVVTTRELLVRAVTEAGLLESAEAQIVYADMLAVGYRGPDDLFSVGAGPR